MFFVVGDIGGEFFLPEFNIVGGRGGSFAAFVPVPEAAVNKDDGFILREHNVRFAGQGFDVFPEAVSRTVQQGTQPYFWLGVFSPDSGHIPTAFFLGEMIHACL